MAIIRCPICQRALSPFGSHPAAPICSEACRKEALRRMGMTEPQGAEGSETSATPQFEQLNATHLYCTTCRRSMPVRERLLLTLPTDDLYGYSCAKCGTDVGTKTDRRAS